MKTVRNYLGVMVVLFAAVQSLASAASIWTVSEWTDDASTGLDSSQTYTHAYNMISSSETVTVNGVEFTGIWGNSVSTDDMSLNNGATGTDGDTNITGDGSDLSSGFSWSHSQLTLSGLTPGEVYQLTIFSVAWEDGTRTASAVNGDDSVEFNLDEYGNNNGIKLDYIYVADDDGILSLEIVSTFHIYAFANCVYTGSMDGLPTTVSAVSPDEYTNGVLEPLDTELVWEEQYPGSLGSPVFDVYLDTDESNVENMAASALVSSQQSDFSYAPELNANTRYYWSVVTYVDGAVDQVTDVRSFKTDSGQVSQWMVSAWTTDRSTRLDSAQTYTHAINLTDSGDVGDGPTVNGVAFTNCYDTLENATLDGGGYMGSDRYDIDGRSAELGTYFRWGGSTLTLTGLTAGEIYQLTLFTGGWYSDGDGGERLITLTNGTDSFDFDQDEYGVTNGLLVRCIYIADDEGQLTLGIESDFHLYAFANCVYTGTTDGLPATISAVSPNDYIEGVREVLDTELVWEELFPDSLTDPVFDVYMDPNESFVTDLDASALVSSQQSEFSYAPAALEPNTIYYWSVVTYVGGEPNQVTDVRSFQTVYADEPWTHQSWSDDSDLDLSLGKVYTHAVNFTGSEGATVTVKGIEFEVDGAGDGAGDNWTLAGISGMASSTHNVTGEGAELVDGFYYGDGAILILMGGLTPGTEYVLTEYTRGYGSAGDRMVQFTTNADQYTTTLDGNMDGEGNGHLFKYTYTAPASGQLIVTLTPLDSSSTWHHYAFSNEEATDIYLDPTPEPGENVDSDLTLSWVLSGDVTDPTYNLTIATDEDLSNAVVTETGLTTASYTASLNSDTSYYWQLEVVEDGTVVHTSPVWDFDTTPPIEAEKLLVWGFDETSGFTAEQTGSAEGGDGTLCGFNDPNTFGVSRVEGLSNNALLLNGKDEYVDICAASSLMPTASGDSFAISGYFRTYKEYGPLLSLRNSDDEYPLVAIAVGYDGSQTAAGEICLLVRDDNASLSGITSGVAINDGLWHNFVVTRISSTWTLYLDGVVCSKINGAATGDITLDLMSIGTSLRWIQDDFGWEINYCRNFEGLIDEFVIWDGELLDSQIEALAAAVPSQGDLDADLDTDIDDLLTLSEEWLSDATTPIQPTVVLEDMESYSGEPNSLASNWVYEADEDYGELALSVVSDPYESGCGQVAKIDYDFAEEEAAYASVILPERGVDAILYEEVNLQIAKPADCNAVSVMLTFYDGRGNENPSDPYYKGDVGFDISEIATDEWVTLTASLPTTSLNWTSCNDDLYLLWVTISGEEEDTGTLYINSIELTDGTADCILEVGATAPDINGDCSVDLLDFAELANDWLNGI